MILSGFKKYLEETPKTLGMWLILGLIVGIPIGLASSIFLYALEFITNYRESNLWIITFLPIVGLLIGWMYQRSGTRAAAGNNLIFQEFFIPQKLMPLLMAPLVLVATLLTHLVGASAGREGTAVQMGAVIADRFHFIGEKFKQQRALFILAGVGAGFASLFATPWAGSIFAIEILRNRSLPLSGLIPSFISSFTAYFTCLLTGAPHTHYEPLIAPQFSLSLLPYLVLAGMLFGLTALLYIKCHQWFSTLATVLVQASIWRPFFGGIILFIVFFALGDSRYMGLGIPTILASFQEPVLPYDFILKLLLTAFTLGFGFKGGEVTPLFFIGATLGNVLVFFIPLPYAFLAGIGFISVFSGATKTFFACAVMGIELFGWESGVYFFLVTFVAQLFSGRASIYKEQPGNRFSIIG